MCFLAFPRTYSSFDSPMDFLNSPPFLGLHLWNLLYDLVTKGSPQTPPFMDSINLALRGQNVPCEIRARPDSSVLPGFFMRHEEPDLSSN